MLQVEWFFLNATDGGRTISTSCRIVDEHNRVIGLEKYEIFCDDTNSKLLFFISCLHFLETEKTCKLHMLSSAIFVLTY